MISPVASKVGQKLMNAFVFRQVPEVKLSDDVFQLIGNSLLEISTVSPCQIDLPQHDIKKIFEFCAENAPGLADRLEIAKADDEHCVHWSLLEMLELAVFGCPEDYTPLTKNAVFAL
jgi:hypothetical protein